MNVSEIGKSFGLISPNTNIEKTSASPFGDVFTDFIKQVNIDQHENNRMLNDFVSGNGVEIHEVMIAGEKAKTSLELLMEIRNKTIDMYKELTRMQ
jgi:flagellar hook-basal body complex protein FliE